MNLPPDIKALIDLGESEHVEFKESFNDDAIKAIGAFSNSNGGIVFVGVSDTKQIKGCQIGNKTIEDIANRIQEATDPRIQPSITFQPIEGKNIIIINVAKSLSVPISVRGRYFKRAGKSDQRMSHEEIMQRLTMSSGISWDAQIELGCTFEDLDLTLVERLFSAIQENGRRPIPQNANAKIILDKLGLIKEGIPTRAALLLFGKNPESYYSSAFIKLGRFRSPTLIVDDREVHGSLLQQLDESMNWFRERLATEFVITGNPEREVKWEYPLNAIREALINLLCHRDYTNGAHSQIRLYDEKLEIRNPGVLLPPLTPELLYQEHDSIPRNRKIAEVFFYMGLIER